jgi:ABC-type Mn2+/Zn2+ transport system ATPase subunit
MSEKPEPVFYARLPFWGITDPVTERIADLIKELEKRDQWAVWSTVQDGVIEVKIFDRYNVINQRKPKVPQPEEVKQTHPTE